MAKVYIKNTVYLIQPAVLITYLFMTIIEFFWVAIILTDSDPVPTTGDYIGFIVFTLIKGFLICSPIVIQRLHSLTVINAILIFLLNSIWLIFMSKGLMVFVTGNVIKLLTLSVIASMVSSAAIIAACLYAVTMCLKRFFNAGTNIT